MRKPAMRYSWLAWLLCLPVFAEDGAEANLQIDVLGLFKNAAMISINGEQQLLKVGEESPEGIKLIDASSRGATVEVNGEALKLDLSSRISAQFSPRQATTVAIQRIQNHYRTSGAINGRPVMFMVDTGATITAMNSSQAAALGIDLSRARTVNAATASGQVGALQLMVERIDVGDIQVSNLLVLVLPGEFPEEILLGMNFLRHVEMSENAGLMLLKSH
jgi:aspartyl protease family protein